MERKRKLRNRRRRTTGSPVVLEALEPRLLLSATPPVITDIAADNRGLVELTVSLNLLASTVDSDAIQVFTAGADGLLGTADDALVTSQISYDEVNRVIRVNANIDADQRYKVEVEGSMIMGVNGCALDAEFNGPGMNTGDGIEGGKLTVFTRPGLDTIVRFSTIAGIIDVEMLTEDTPLTVANFFNYMNRGDWDTTFFHRNASLGDGTPFVVQGGGFNADQTFSDIPSDPTVRNEPGISNIRGTIAMAKIGNNPNSATNQWFFNLGDNSENLDNQNGGFTVFGRITDAAGLAVMDALAEFETVNATSQNPAFGDLPVQDLMAVEDRDGIVLPSDLIRVTRIARLFEITGEPFLQLPVAGLEQVTSPGGQATVTIWSLNGVDLGRLDEFLDIRFSGQNGIASIRVVGDIPAPIGIQISGADSISAIQDRGGADDNLRFIVSDTAIDQISIRGSMIGADLNGVLLADNLLLPDDVDNDGTLGDNTAIYIVDGFIKTVSIGEDLTGSVIVPEGVASMTVGDRVSNASLLLGDDTVFRSSSFRFGEARSTSLATATPISRLQTGQWTGPGLIEAPSIGSLNVRGGRDATGDFEANLELTGADFGQTLRSANVSGVGVRSLWNIEGDVGSIRIREGLGNWTLRVDGDVQAVMTGPVETSSVVVNGMLGRLMATEWYGGVIEADAIISMQIRGNRDDSGDLFADLDIGQVVGTSIRSLMITGDWFDSDAVLAGDLRAWRMGGDMDGVNLRTGDLPANVRLQHLTDTAIVYQTARNFSVESWDGGRLQGGDIGLVQATGDRRDDIPGDFRANINVRNLRSFFVEGDYEGDATFRQALNRMYVRGDIVDSTVVYQRAQIFDNLLGDVIVDGSLIRSELRAEGFARDIVVGAMFDSTISLGTSQPGLTAFPANGNAFQPFSVNSVIIRGLDDADVAMSNSFILGGIIEFVRITNPDTVNNQPFGVAAFQINSIATVHLDGSASVLNNPTTPPDPVGSYEIRPRFIAPTTTV